MTLQKKIIARLTAVVMMTVSLSHPSFAINSSMQMNGQSFSSACTRADQLWISFCNGYVQAVVDSLREADGICIPNGTTRTQIVSLVEKEITGSTRLRAMNAHSAIITVMRRGYAC
jgi:hypothetical protein